MHGKDAIRNAYDVSQMVVTSYVNDLSDAELLTRPAEGCKHLAWQLGHLISSECGMLDMVGPGHSIELPADFAEKHGKGNADSDAPGDFLSKDEYLGYLAKLKEATFATLDSQTDEDLAKPGPEPMRSLCPTVGALFVMIATHPLMHAGQFVPVRRKLGKPIVI